MFIIQCQSKKIPGRMTPVISGYHGKGKMVLNVTQAVKYKTLQGATKAALKIPSDFEHKIIEI